MQFVIHFSDQLLVGHPGTPLLARFSMIVVSYVLVSSVTQGGRMLRLLSGRRTLIVRMRIFRQLGVLVLLLSFLAPVMACMVPNAEMSTQERACCRMMKDQCGQMGMPASHGCCHKTPLSVHENALNTKTVTFCPVVAPITCLAAPELVNPASAITGWVEQPDYSPPKSPPSTISILRV